MTAFRLALVLLVQHAACNVEPPSAGNISCGNGEQRALCSLCPHVYRDGEFMRQDLGRCLGDCELTRVGSEYVCVPQVPSAPETPEPIDPADPPADAPTPSTSPAPEYPEYSPPPATLLSMVELNIVNSGSSRPNKVSFLAKVCIGQTCCQTGVMRKRSGLFKFGSAFGNHGNCTQLRKRPNDAIVVAAMIGPGWAGMPTATPLKVHRITAQFDDGSIYTAENFGYVREEGGYFGSWQRTPVPWNTARRATRSNVQSEATYDDPQPHCPEHATDLTNTNTNTCPKANIRVLRRLRDERKFCYYQECDTYTKDLSTVETGRAGLGSGGYCKSRRERFPQYQYCCDLEQYFTLDDEQATPKPREQIHFPRCPTMIPMTP